ncbi:MAG TPA: hypothetical protein VII78_06860 [Myxococcota bacterium]|jgi:hypothetical protein
MEPSAKGSVVSGVVASLRSSRKRGHISAEQLAARLSGPALSLLEEKIEAGRWYPMSAFQDLVDCEWELAGRDPEYARESGARSADRMSNAGIYQQLEYAKRVDRAQSRDALVRQTKLITTVTGTLYSFLSLSVRVSADGGLLEIVYANAAQFPEALRYSTEGFMNRINEQQGSGRRWTSERTKPGEIVFRLKLPSRMAGES